MNDQTVHPTSPAEPGKLPVDLDSLTYEQLEALAHAAWTAKLRRATPPPPPEDEEDRAYDAMQDQLHRQAWALLGQLVLLKVIPMPSFDLSKSEDFAKAGERLHTVVMSLAVGLERIDQQALV